MTEEQVKDTLKWCIEKIEKLEARVKALETKDIPVKKELKEKV